MKCAFFVSKQPGNSQCSYFFQRMVPPLKFGFDQRRSQKTLDLEGPSEKRVATKFLLLNGQGELFELRNYCTDSNPKELTFRTKNAETSQKMISNISFGDSPAQQVLIEWNG